MLQGVVAGQRLHEVAQHLQVGLHLVLLGPPGDEARLLVDRGVDDVGDVREPANACRGGLVLQVDRQVAERLVAEDLGLAARDRDDVPAVVEEAVDGRGADEAAGPGDQDGVRHGALLGGRAERSGCAATASRALERTPAQRRCDAENTVEAVSSAVKSRDAGRHPTRRYSPTRRRGQRLRMRNIASRTSSSESGPPTPLLHTQVGLTPEPTRDVVEAAYGEAVLTGGPARSRTARSRSTWARSATPSSTARGSTGSSRRSPR